MTSAFCLSLSQYSVCFDESLLNWTESKLSLNISYVPSIHSLFSNILNTYSIPGTVLGVWCTVLGKADSVPPAQSHCLGGTQTVIEAAMIQRDECSDESSRGG